MKQPRPATGGEDVSENWMPIESAPDKTVVETKIDDAKGMRNQTRLKCDDNLWWFPDGSMYVYYRPTHWRPCLPPAPAPEK